VNFSQLIRDTRVKRLRDEASIRIALKFPIKKGKIKRGNMGVLPLLQEKGHRGLIHKELLDYFGTLKQ